MSDLLAFEADKRAVNITINRYPYGHEELAICENIDQVRGVMEKYPPYQSIFAKISYGESQMLDKAFYEEEVKRLCLAFEQQEALDSAFFPLNGALLRGPENKFSFNMSPVVLELLNSMCGIPTCSRVLMILKRASLDCDACIL
ncbi:hypothetical protein ZIOFF_042264 [Zingiber officinale]|uniref:Uncharacterized protein n=1 Tax=Zingiber officinale TaxID=94328 RepID=A0A8J5GES1_ZINOF|nr:hypothetical protein ZIOFF_042264 [Zingiber officinale]